MAEKETVMITDEITEEIVGVAEEIARQEGVRAVTVRKIISKMGVTNRVFYNRFANVDAVWELIYLRAVNKMHESLESEYDVHTDFFRYVMDVVVKVLVNTYEVKNRFSQYMFEFDSIKEANRIWWTDKIREIIEIGKATGQLKPVDSEKLSYTVWCFLRGYNADAVNRKLSQEEAAQNVKFGMQCLFDGVKNA